MCVWGGGGLITVLAVKDTKRLLDVMLSTRLQLHQSEYRRQVLTVRAH